MSAFQKPSTIWWKYHQSDKEVPEWTEITKQHYWKQQIWRLKIKVLCRNFDALERKGQKVSKQSKWMNGFNMDVELWENCIWKNLVILRPSLHVFKFAQKIKKTVLKIIRCGHCKKMAPVLDKVAPELQGKLAIGKIDCTIHKSLCNEYKVRGYPTLKYALDGEINDYPGSRDEKSIISFATKMSSPALTPVGSYEDVMEYAKTKTAEGVLFLGYDPASTKDEPTSFYQVFSQVARKNQASGYFLWLDPADEDSVKSPAFVKRIEPDVIVRHLENVETLTVESLSEWYSTQNVPMVANLGPSNFQKIGNKGRPLAISVADVGNEEQVKSIKDHMLDYITKTGNENYYYGIMDGKKFSKFLEQFNVLQEHTPQFLVLDVPTKTYWQNETYGNLFHFMKAVDNGEITSAVVSRSSAQGLLNKLEFMFLHYFPYSLIVLLLFVVGFVFLLIPPAENFTTIDDLEGEEEDLAAAEEKEKDDTQPKESKKDK